MLIFLWLVPAIFHCHRLEPCRTQDGKVLFGAPAVGRFEEGGDQLWEDWKSSSPKDVQWLVTSIPQKWDDDSIWLHIFSFFKKLQERERYINIYIILYIYIYYMIYMYILYTDMMFTHTYIIYMYVYSASLRNVIIFYKQDWKDHGYIARICFEK